ncbi:LysM peptidoglycan-binding domain-containing protein [Bisbaumannia pacifica]|uniref:LysM peptidoglycan-binding domain-containing protein n=1 Tax=Bisbaumannia pacifica TaxID=77098 RepID=A0ABD4KYJ5_9GAMM|nr:LysM peptidoglycan-binding domain-containing protein [Halomonas pacifica]
MKRCVRYLCGGALVALIMAWVAAAQAQSLSYAGLRDDAPERYTVVRGDTLWDISGRFLRHPWQWPEIWQVNPQIRNPHLIYPGDIIYLADCNGRPCLRLERGQGVVRLSPEVRRVPHREAIAPLPLEVVEHFLRRHRVVDEAEGIENLAYVVGGDDRRLVSGAGDAIYVRGALPDTGRLGIYRLGERYEDPQNGELLGIELLGVGRALWLRRDGEISRLEITESDFEVRNGDLILPVEEREWAGQFLPRAPERAISGRILAVPGGVQFIGRLQVVALDLGRRDGIAAGHVLRVEQQGELVTDPNTNELIQLPGEEAGLVMVFRPFEKVSYALVMQATRTLAVGDRVYHPDRRELLADAP